MLLNDEEIAGLMESGVLEGADKESIGPVTCDLHTKDFVTDGTRGASVVLGPGDSTFVECQESVRLPQDLAARVLIRNSRIREGLSLDAPLYFPGHETVIYFRVTNISGSRISLKKDGGIAQIAFERLEHPAKTVYSGAYQSEMSFSGLGSYHDVYKDEIEELDNRVDEVKGIEKRLYANVMAIMAILAGVFTLVNVNIQAAGQGAADLVTMNLATVGSFSALVALIGIVTGGKSASVKSTIIIAAICFIAAALLSAAII